MGAAAKSGKANRQKLRRYVGPDKAKVRVGESSQSHVSAYSQAMSDFLQEVDGMDLKNIFNVGYQGFPDGSVSFFSDRICELVGYGKEEFNNKSINWIKDVMCQEDLPQR